MMNSKDLKKRKGDRFVGLADIGSNTIHGVVYKISEDGEVKQILNHKDSTELISYIYAGMLSDDGVDRLCAVVKQLREIFELVRCDETDFFATSAVRSSRNCADVLRTVREETGVDVRLVDGREEAMYDYIAMKGCCCEENAVGLDLGGGSMQAVLMENGELVRSTSIGCGCLRIYNSFVHGILPTEKEIGQIEEYVKYMLNSDTVMCSIRREFAGRPDSGEACRTYIMGGTARAFGKFDRVLENTSRNRRVYTVRADALDRAVNAFKEDEGYSVYITNRLFPERLCTFLPGIIVFRAVTEFLGSRELCVIKDGIREGVLQYEHL